MFADFFWIPAGPIVLTAAGQRWFRLPLQALAVGCLLLLPLLYTEGLPRLAMLAPLLAPAPPPRSRQPAPPQFVRTPAQSNMMETGCSVLLRFRHESTC